MILLHSNAARSCPIKTQNAFHPGLVRPAPTTPIRSWLPDADGFIAEVTDRVLAGNGRVVDLRPLREQSVAEQEAACLAALDSGADVLLGGRLPRDEAGHRVGRPDLLIRDPAGGYVPGQVKPYRVLESRGDGVVTSCAPLEDLTARADRPGWRYRWHYRWTNALQLAHYHRILQAVGHAGAAWGVLLGRDEVDGDGPLASWIDLTEAAVPPSPEQPDETTTALARYDLEFARRLAIAEQAAAADPSDEPALLPIVTRECSRCTWWEVCRARLDPDDLSLRISKSPLDAHEITVLREAGVRTVHDLAAADLDALLPGYLPRVTHRQAAEDRLRLAQRRSLLLLDGVTLERTNPDPVDLPTSRLEIDIDLETSFDNRVYLWGFWVTDRSTGESGYRQFSDFRELDDDAELALARQALGWLRERVGGSDARVYHYSPYEVDRIGRLAKASGDPALEWAVGFAREHFVDLFGVVRRHFFGINGLGLKVVASAGAGFSWRDEHPGGLNSMHWFEDAVGAATPEQREQARTRLLEYNEDDVRATHRVRAWLRSL